MTTESSAICVFFWFRYGDSVVLVTLTANLLSNNVDIEWEIGRLAISVNFSNGVTVLVVCDSQEWSTNAVIVFVVLGCQGIVRDDRLGFCSCFTSGSFIFLHRQVWEMYEAVCRVDDYTVVPHKIQPFY